MEFGSLYVPKTAIANRIIFAEMSINFLLWRNSRSLASQELGTSAEPWNLEHKRAHGLLGAFV